MIENGAAEEHRDEPVNVVDRVDGDQYVVDDCAVCGKRHRFGGSLAPGEHDYRIAHCVWWAPGYYLRLPDESNAGD